MFAKHDDDIWYFDRVHPKELKQINIVGFGFENVEVFSMDSEVIEEIQFSVFPRELSSVPDYIIDELSEIVFADSFHIKLKKDKLIDGRHISLNGMFGDTNEESIQYLKQHFSTPDLVSIILFDEERREKSSIYIPYEGESLYFNESVEITEEDKYIKISAMTDKIKKDLNVIQSPVINK